MRLQALAEKCMELERAERNLGEMKTSQAKWEQELQQKNVTHAEQVPVDAQPLHACSFHAEAS